METENRNFTIGTAMLRAFPAIMFGVLAVPLMAAQDQGGAARNQPATSAQDEAAPAAKFKAGKALADTVKRNGNEAQPQSCQSATDTRAGDPVPGIGLPRALGDASVGKAKNVAPGQRTAAAPTITHEYHRVGDAEVCPPETPDTRSGDSGEN